MKSRQEKRDGDSCMPRGELIYEAADAALDAVDKVIADHGDALSYAEASCIAGLIGDVIRQNARDNMETESLEGLANIIGMFGGVLH
jgi:hypothetical protein